MGDETERSLAKKRGFGWKRFFLVPLLFVGYLLFVEMLVAGDFPIGAFKQQEYSPGGEVLTMGEAVSVSVVRPYFFGLLKLPIYVNYLGSIADMHTFFFSFLAVLTGAFVVLEIKNKAWG